jgi:hypothetical protein
MKIKLLFLFVLITCKLAYSQQEENILLEIYSSKCS